MLIFVQVCRTINKKLNVFNSSISSIRTNESNEIYKKEACVARMKTESEDKERMKTLKLFSHQVHLEFLNNFHILDILES